MSISRTLSVVQHHLARTASHQWSESRIGVAVGTALSGRPPLGSQRAVLPHWALALGPDHKPHIRKRMAACRTRSSALCAPSRLCVRGAFCRPAFPRALAALTGVGQLPSLHPLRPCHVCTLRRFVRELRRYYGAVRFPTSVRHRITSLDFPMRPASPSDTGERGTSRFSHVEIPHMQGAFDPAGSAGNLALCTPVPFCLPRLTPRRHPEGVISGLDPTGAAVDRTLPMRTPVNASPTLLRKPAHDSGPPWAANPSM